MPEIVKDKIYRATSPFVRRFAKQVVASASGKPILDVACGSGRNAFFLERIGGTVICIDRDLSSFNANPLVLRDAKTHPVGLVPRVVDLVKDPWPFTMNSVGGIINIDFLLPMLFPFFARSLSPGGLFLLETVSGRGGNYRELPQEGELKAALGQAFDLTFYEERSAGPSGQSAVAVKLLARRKAYPTPHDVN
jgi:SAM-dependent methyltransferase